MKLKFKRAWITILFKFSGVLSAIGNWLYKLSVKIATYAEDKNSKWFYTQAFVLGAESEISDAIRNSTELPIKPVAIVADGGVYYLVYDYEMHKVRELKKTRVYLNKEDAYEAIKGFVTTRNFARITVDEATETATLSTGVEPVFKSTTVTTVYTEPKKGNGKRHIKHDKKQSKTKLKKGNGKYNKKPQTKKKVVKKAGK